MHLEHLSLTNLRCHDSVEVALPPGLSVFVGDNGSGKTSLLEAAYLLSRTQSFRGSRSGDLIRRGAQSVVVSGQVQSAEQAQRVAVERSRQSLSTRLGTQRDVGLMDLLRAVRVQVIDPRLHQLVDDGPSYRRRFMDWGVFHVEHGFVDAWRSYSRLLRQRNAACKAGDRRALAAFDPAYQRAALHLHELRSQYLANLADRWAAICSTYLPDLAEPSLRYKAGWPADRSLAQALIDSRQRELEAGYTLVGPHRADFVVACDGRQVRHQLSRGQQKMLIIALAAAQMFGVAHATGETPIMLLDDLSSELGANYRRALVDIAKFTQGQWLMTQLEATEPVADVQMFHVEHGAVTPR